MSEIRLSSVILQKVPSKSHWGLPPPIPGTHRLADCVHSGAANTDRQTDRQMKKYNVGNVSYTLFPLHKKIFISLNIDLEKKKKGQSHKKPSTPQHPLHASWEVTCSSRSATLPCASTAGGFRPSVTGKKRALLGTDSDPDRCAGAVLGSGCAGQREQDVLRAERPGRGQGGLRVGTRTEPRDACY